MLSIINLRANKILTEAKDPFEAYCTAIHKQERNQFTPRCLRDTAAISTVLWDVRRVVWLERTNVSKKSACYIPKAEDGPRTGLDDVEETNLATIATRTPSPRPSSPYPVPIPTLHSYKTDIQH
jgi:hypothetical protein